MVLGALATTRSSSSWTSSACPRWFTPKVVSNPSTVTVRCFPAWCAALQISTSSRSHPAENGGRRLAHRRQAREVEIHDRDIVVAARRARGVADGRTLRRVARGEQHGRARSRQLVDERAADAVGPAGHDHDAAAQVRQVLQRLHTLQPVADGSVSRRCVGAHERDTLAIACQRVSPSTPHGIDARPRSSSLWLCRRSRGPSRCRHRQSPRRIGDDARPGSRR